ncbi:LDLR chaperone boca [Nymphon striatum]|nr:LDLR chaperone boca [Nymphon striatum]
MFLLLNEEKDNENIAFEEYSNKSKHTDMEVVRTASSEEKKKKKKSLLDYNDADMERLFDEWEKNDDPLEEDELPHYLRKKPLIDVSKLDPSNPEAMLKMSKKGSTLMTFVKVSGNPTKSESDDLTKIWQTGLMNNHINVERYMLEDNRAIFMFKDGEQAFEAKDFLIEQERLEEVVIDSKSFPGKFSKKVIIL